MAEFSTHNPGTFTWPELATTDQKGAVTFYRLLFGWDVNEMPMGPGETYSMFQLKGKEVGAACTQQAPERQMGVPPHWNSYVTVKNVDESAKKAESLGGKLFMPPFDVMDAGRYGGASGSDRRGLSNLGGEAEYRREDLSTSPARSAGPSSRPSDTKAAESFYSATLRLGAEALRAAWVRRWNTPS